MRRRVFAAVLVLLWALSLLGVFNLGLASWLIDAELARLTSTVLVGATISLIVAWLLGAVITEVVMRPFDEAVGIVGRAQDHTGLVEVMRGTVDVELRQTLDAVIRLQQLEASRSASKLAFVAALVHDLKTTIAGIGLLYEQHRLAYRNAKDEELLKEIETSRQWLGKALDALRVSEVDVVIRRELCSLDELCKEVVRSLPDWSESSVHITVEGSSQGLVDPAELSRALGNLVSNARRAARSHVTVEVFNGLIRVSDDGPGLPAPFDVLSQPFHRVEMARSLTTSGTGLGLYVARRILELHGGRLVCERSDSRGVVFLAYVGG